jgi:hypothetical protein
VDNLTDFNQNRKNTMYLDKVKKRFEELNFVPLNKIMPCTEQDIETLQKQLNCTLPLAYKEFLLWMGRGAGQFMTGSLFFYDDLEDMQLLATEMLEEDEFPQLLPTDAFVVWAHQGYQFTFFRLNEGDNPPIYYYREMQPEKTFPQTDKCFSDYLTTEIESHAKLAARLNQN